MTDFAAIRTAAAASERKSEPADRQRAVVTAISSTGTLNADIGQGDALAGRHHKRIRIVVAKLQYARGSLDRAARPDRRPVKQNVLVEVIGAIAGRYPPHCRSIGFEIAQRIVVGVGPLLRLPRNAARISDVASCISAMRVPLRWYPHRRRKRGEASTLDIIPWDASGDVAGAGAGIASDAAKHN